jgi:hypothetical protein
VNENGRPKGNEAEKMWHALLGFIVFVCGLGVMAIVSLFVIWVVWQAGEAMF